MRQAKQIIKDLNLPGSTIGTVIASINEEHEKLVREKLGNLAHQLNFTRNVNEIMITPERVNKGMGLKIAMQYLNLDMEKAILIGDGENDVDMFLNPGFKIALSNAAPKLKKLANQITRMPATKGVWEVIEKLET